MSSSLNSIKLNVYVKEGKSETLRFVNTVNRGKAVFLSVSVRKQLHAGGIKGDVSKGEIHDANSVVFFKEQVNPKIKVDPFVQVDYDSAHILVNFINDFKSNTNKGLTVEHVGSKNFEKVIRAYAAFHHLIIDRTVRGNTVRDLIRAAPPTLRKLTLLHKIADFDRGLVFETIRQYAHAKWSVEPANLNPDFESYVWSIKLNRTMEKIEYEEYDKIEAEWAAQGKAV